MARAVRRRDEDRGGAIALTPREKFLSAAQSATLTLGSPSSVAIAPSDRFAPVQGGFALADVLGPFGRALADGRNLANELAEDLASGEKALADYAARTTREIEAALEAGFDGIAYRIAGAEPTHSTPMAYGGHFLEVDRELLAACPESAVRVLMVQGGEGAYLDFLSDLPAEAIAWDVEATGVGAAQMKGMRGGLVATCEGGDVVLSDRALLSGRAGEAARG